MTLDELYRLLRSGHVQTQGIVDTLSEALVVLDKEFTVVSANPAFFRTFKADRDSTLGQTLFALGDGQWDIPELRLLLADVVPKSAAIVGYQVSHTFPEMGQRTILVSARQLVHPDGHSTHMLVVFEDITERERSDRAKDILLAETRHRMKNLMATVRAVARQTEAEGLTGEQYRNIFLGRFEAVLNAQEFVSVHGSQADLGALVEQSLQSLAGPRAEVTQSVPVALSQYQVLPVSMILHELATNALKYGALSVANGMIHIGWHTEQADGATRLLLDWREQGGPPVSPPSRRGFGTELIEYSCKSEGGEAVLDFDPSGLHVQISLLVER